MDKKRFQQLKDLVTQALEVDAAQRQAFLAEACGSDEELINEALQLLAHDAPDATELTLTLHDVSDLKGKTIGPYRIIEQIGEGGMGVVYLASQGAPLRRRVAVKVIKVGMDTKEVIARFESERQALAVMDHPNIATVYDAGATAEGRPYFVMEYIKGVPLNRYCDDHGLDLPGRLDLFVQVCQGVQHAHQKGIIHRDLKPGNILVTEIAGEPVPKIIDFGVSKAMASSLGGQTLFTKLGQLIGTPEYMSPEQAGSAVTDVDTRSDVYSLGVLLYELLTGTLPLARRDILQAGVDQMVHLVRHEVPKKPSTRIDTEAKQAKPSTHHPAKDTHLWVKRVRGDLDWITMKALEKDRERRYGSAADLATDVVRHLESRAVSAGPPSGAYRLRKFVRRNRVGVAFGLILLLALLAGATGTTIGLVRANREMSRATAAEAVALDAARQAEAAVLYQLSRSRENPAHGLPFILAALDRHDRLDYRLQAKRLLLAGPSCWRLPAYPEGINPYPLDFSPDGNWLAVGWVSGDVQLYSLDGGEPRILSDHREWDPRNIQRIRVERCLFSWDSRYLATTYRDSTVDLWLPDEDRLLRTLRCEGLAVPFFDRRQDRLITVTRRADQASLWQSWPLPNGTPVDLGTTGVMSESIPCDLDPTGRWLVQAVAERLYLYDLDDLAQGPVRVVGRHDRPVAVVAISPDGRTVFSADADGSGSFWDLESPGGVPTRTILTSRSPTFVRFDAKGERMTVGGSRSLTVWDLKDHPAAEPIRLRGTGHWVFAGAFHPDGQWLVTTGDELEVAAWPLGNSKVLTFRPAAERVGDMGFSPDGRHFIVGSRNGTLWDYPLSGAKVGSPRLLHAEPGWRFCALSFDARSRDAFLASCGAPEFENKVMRVPLDGRAVEVMEDLSSAYTVSGSGRLIAYVAEASRGLVAVYDAETGERVVLDESRGGFDKVIGRLRADQLLVGRTDGAYGCWDQARQTFAPFELGRIAFVWPAPDGNTLLGLDEEFAAWRSSLDDTTWVRFPLEDPSYGWPWLHGATFDSSLTYMVSGVHDGLDHFLIDDLVSGDKHLYPLFDVPEGWGALDPRKRWIATTTNDKQGLIKLIRRPSGVPFESLPGDELLARLRDLTNLRAEADSTAVLGFSAVGGGIPDWDQSPIW